MYFPVLDRSPKVSASYYADVHISPVITLCAQLFSTAVQQIAPDRLIIQKNVDGFRKVFFKAFDGAELHLLPPIRNPQFQPWIDWIKQEYQRAWWIITTAWMLDKELVRRFPGVKANVDQIRLNLWTQGGATRVFQKSGITVDNFPLVLPENVKTADHLVGDTIDTYRHFYASLQQQHRMKWTNTPKPEFLGGPKVTSLVTSEGVYCGICSPTSKVGKPSSAGCGNEGCPWKEGE